MLWLLTQNTKYFRSLLQGIFCRYPDNPPRENMQLRIEKSIMHTQTLRFGIIGVPQGTVAETSHILDTIGRNTQAGGRLLCIEMTGQVAQSSMSNAMHGISPSKYWVIFLFLFLA
jgi:hypothetical protein